MLFIEHRRSSLQHALLKPILYTNLDRESLDYFDTKGTNASVEFMRHLMVSVTLYHIIRKMVFCHFSDAAETLKNEPLFRRYHDEAVSRITFSYISMHTCMFCFVIFKALHKNVLRDSGDEIARQ